VNFREKAAQKGGERIAKWVGWRGGEVAVMYSGSEEANCRPVDEGPKQLSTMCESCVQKTWPPPYQSSNIGKRRGGKGKWEVRGRKGEKDFWQR